MADVACILRSADEHNDKVADVLCIIRSAYDGRHSSRVVVDHDKGVEIPCLRLSRKRAPTIFLVSVPVLLCTAWRVEKIRPHNYVYNTSIPGQTCKQQKTHPLMIYIDPI